MKLRHFLGLTLGLLVCFSGSLQAQPGGRGGAMGGKPAGVNPALVKVFGKNNAFSANVQMTVFTSAGKEAMSGPAKFAFSEGSSYWYMDVAEVKSDSMPPQAVAQMKAMGMTQMTTITKAGSSTYYMVYPGMQAYVELPTSPSEDTTGKSEIKTEAVGEETVNGFKCKKNKSIVTYEGKSQEILSWNAAELKDFPVRVEFKDNDSGSTVRMDYSEVKLVKPDAKMFTPPADFTKYSNIQEMLQSVMMKRMAPPAK